MNNIIEVAKNNKEIMASQHIRCPKCGQKQFAPFDKLYTKVWGLCIDCENVDVLKDRAEYIFMIIEG